MATPSARRKQVLREDPPETMLDPNTQALLLTDTATGKTLPGDGCTKTHQYVWVDKGNQHQVASYQGRHYQPARLGNCGGVEPLHKSFQQIEATDASASDLIERFELFLMYRPLAARDAEKAYSDKMQQQRAIQMGHVDPSFAQAGRRSGIRVKNERDNYEGVEED